MTVRLDDLPAHFRARVQAELARQQAERAQPRAPRRSPATRPPDATAAHPDAPAPVAFGGGTVTVGTPPVARRVGDTLWLRLAVAPRTKKNHGRGVAKESAAYTRFAFHVRELLAPMAAALGLPLPARRYNCAARFAVDNDRADTVGLMQGLADALEPHARSGFVGVVTNDRQLWTWDGTAQAHAPLRPCVELTLTPLED